MQDFSYAVSDSPGAEHYRLTGVCPRGRTRIGGAPGALIWPSFLALLVELTRFFFWDTPQPLTLALFVLPCVVLRLREEALAGSGRTGLGAG
jgi:hypothetical protein